MLAPRIRCLRCRRPAGFCYCAHLDPIPSRTRLVFFQHPRERRVAIGTARMAHLALPHSELHVAADPDLHPRLQAVAAGAAGRAAVLFPGPGAIEPDALPGGAPETLVVIDGTWIQARKMLARSRLLQSLPRIGFTPARPGAYRIRREPAAYCLATIEAVVEILGRLESDPERFTPLLGAFTQMVDQQIPFGTARTNPYRRLPRRRAPGPDPVRARLRDRRDDLVVVYGEANAHPRDTRLAGQPELIQLVAWRPATRARFAATIAPRRPLAAAVPAHLEVDAADLLGGEDVADALARFARFVRDGDVFCTWGRYTLDLLRAEGVAEWPAIDLREASARLLGRRSGGPEPAARLLVERAAAVGDQSDPRWAADDVPPASHGGRAARRLAALVTVVERLAAAS